MGALLACASEQKVGDTAVAACPEHEKDGPKSREQSMGRRCIHDEAAGDLGARRFCRRPRPCRESPRRRYLCRRRRCSSWRERRRGRRRVRPGMQHLDIPVPQPGSIKGESERPVGALPAVDAHHDASSPGHRPTIAVCARRPMTALEPAETTVASAASKLGDVSADRSRENIVTIRIPRGRRPPPRRAGSVLPRAVHRCFLRSDPAQTKVVRPWFGLPFLWRMEDCATGVRSNADGPCRGSGRRPPRGAPRGCAAIVHPIAWAQPTSPTRKAGA